MKTGLVPVETIEVHWSLNRARDCDHVRALATHINRDGFNEKYPVRLIKFADGSLHLAAGYHRFAAAIGEHVKELGGGYARDLTFENLPLASVPAETILGNMDDVIRLIQIDNFKHDAAVNADVGKALSRAEKKEQCLRLLGFPEFFGKSLRVLETEFGLPRSTIGTLKKDLTVRLGQCAERELSDLELLNEFGLTRARFDKMLLLIRSGARAGADGRVTKTQASAVKKESALARAAAEFETSKSSVQNLIDEICDELFSLDRADVQRRLFSHFGISGADIANMSSDELKKERAAFSELQADLQNRNRGLWWHEFRGFHNAYQLRSELEGLGPNFEVDESASALERAREIETARFESQARDARLTELKILKDFLAGAIARENTEREKQVKAHDELKNVCELASRACSSLVREFRERALQPDAVGQNFRAFISAALEFPKTPAGYSDSLSVAEMTNPKDLKNTGRAYAVRGVAEKLRADLTSDEPPAWMHSFLKVQNPPPPAENPVPVLPSSVEKARAPELLKTVYDPGADTRVPVQKSDNQNAEEQVAARGLGRSEMSDLKPDSALTREPSADTLDLENELQAHVDAASALVPERGRCTLVSKYAELFSEEDISDEEEVAILCDLLLRAKSRLQRARLTKS